MVNFGNICYIKIAVKKESRELFMDSNNGFAIFMLIIFGIIVASIIWDAIYSIKIKIFFDGLERALRNARTVTDCKYIIIRDNNDINKNS